MYGRKRHKKIRFNYIVNIIFSVNNFNSYHRVYDGDKISSLSSKFESFNTVYIFFIDNWFSKYFTLEFWLQKHVLYKWPRLD